MRMRTTTYKCRIRDPYLIKCIGSQCFNVVEHHCRRVHRVATQHHALPVQRLVRPQHPTIATQVEHSALPNTQYPYRSIVIAAQ